MTWIEALILGVLQGITEFLPVSSSGHLAIAKELFGVETQDLSFEVVVHAATVLSTITVFGKEIWQLFKGCLKCTYNSDTRYVLMLILSMLPVLGVGLFFKSQVTLLFGQGIALVGFMLLFTALLLVITRFAPSQDAPFRYRDAFVMGLSQAIAVLPGLSRSGATLSTGLLLGKDRGSVAKFSFLMVLVPVLGEALITLTSGGFALQSSNITTLALCIGFVTAYLCGLATCRWMIALVKRAKLWVFALYCAVVGVFCLCYPFLA